METIFFDVDGVILDFTGPFSIFWNEGIKNNIWKGINISSNPHTWSFGLDVKDPHFIEALKIFHEVHEDLPLLNCEVKEVMDQLHNKFFIELVTSYPHLNKRIKNLLFHNIPYDKLSCDVNDKVSYIQKSGSKVVAIFEDGPHHIDKYLSYYPGKIWAPNQWNYLIDYKQNPKIIFYDNPKDWLKLLNY